MKREPEKRALALGAEATRRRNRGRDDDEELLLLEGFEEEEAGPAKEVVEVDGVEEARWKVVCVGGEVAGECDKVPGVVWPREGGRE